MLRHRPKMPDRAPLLDRSARLAAKNQRVTIEGIVARHEQMMLVSKGEQGQLVLVSKSERGRLPTKTQGDTIEGIVARHEQMMLVSKGEQCQLVLQPWRRPPMRLRLRPWSQ